MEEKTIFDQDQASQRVTRREFNRLGVALGASCLMPRTEWAAASVGTAFIHPGILHTSADLDRMRKGVRQKRSPIAEGFEKFREHPSSQSAYISSLFGEEIGRNPSVNNAAFDNDSNAAYQCSLMAAITGEERYAVTAKRIVAGWSTTLQRVSGADAVLMAGLGPFKLINAAEILRALGALDGTGTAQFAAMLRRAILPTIIDFAPFANGNWDTAAMKTLLAIAVFCDDKALFERALQYYLRGDGDGSLTHYIHENGQCQESGRDQQHTQLGLAHMGDVCEIAWNQGLDLYGAVENRLLRGFEYTAGYNLGDPAKFEPDVDRTGKYRHQVISPRSALRPVYEQLFAHYHMRRGLPTPALARAVRKLRPEAAAQGADHTGFGTLLYALEPSDVQQPACPTAPAGVHAELCNGAVQLNWIAPRSADQIWIERAEETGIFHRIKALAGGSATFRDSPVRPGRKYQYRVVAHHRGMSEFLSSSVTKVMGLPSGWSEGPLGNPSIQGNVQFDGETMTICAAGVGLLGSSDEGHFVGAPFECAALGVRYVAQTASQALIFGLAYRAGMASNAPCVALLISPQSGNPERHDWHIRLAARERNEKIKTISDIVLEAPTVKNGRLMEPVWLRLERKQSLIAAQFSTDGVRWKSAGATEYIESGRIGIAMSSGISDQDASVRFDTITVSK